MSGLFHINAREHGALLLMSTLARLADGDYLRLQNVAEEVGISNAYLEEIAAALKAAELIQGRQGPGGGYRLMRHPKEISIEQILVAIEGPLTLVDCQSQDASCPLEATCSSKHVWNHVHRALQQTLRSTSLAQTL